MHSHELDESSKMGNKSSSSEYRDQYTAAAAAEPLGPDSMDADHATLATSGGPWNDSEMRAADEDSIATNVTEQGSTSTRPTFVDMITTPYCRADAEACIRHHTSPVKLLLLGPGESGKSTIVKQMQILHLNGFNKRQRKEKIKDIRKNLRNAIMTIVGAMGSLKGGPLSVADDENQERLEYVLHMARTTADDDTSENYSEEFYDNVQALWRDANVQACYRRAHEYQLIDCARYFLDRVDVIRQDSYEPTDQDILWCRVVTTGIQETKFVVNAVEFHMFDVGGQRDERRRWIQCFNDLTAIIFVVAVSSYNMALREDPARNRMIESLELFGRVWNNRWLQAISIILFFNKIDLLREQIYDDNSKIELYFTDYVDYLYSPPTPEPRRKCCWFQSDDDDEHQRLSEQEDPEFTRAKLFFRDMFKTAMPPANSHSDEDRYDVPYERRDSAAVRRCYFHFTCAVDTGNIKLVFDDCRFIIMKENMRRWMVT